MSSLVWPAAALLLSPFPARPVLRLAGSHSTGQQTLGIGRHQLASWSSSGSLDDQRGSWRSSGLLLYQETAEQAQRVNTRLSTNFTVCKSLGGTDKGHNHTGQEQFYHH